MLRKQELDKASDKSRKELAKTQAEFFTTLANNRDQWAKEEEEHSKRLKEMAKEIKVLEKNKEQAMIPVKMFQEQAKKQIKENAEYLVQLANKEHDLDERRDLVEDKLDELGQREQDIALNEQKQAATRLSLQTQANASIEATKALNGQIADFMARKVVIETDLDKRKTAIILQERTIESKHDSIKRTEEALRTWAKQLQDQRATLERAMKRISP
jgi:hypothetical protein